MTTTATNLNSSAALEFIEHYIEYLEVMPQDIQRQISQLRELDSTNKINIEKIGKYTKQYNNEERPDERRRLLSKLQTCLIASQRCGDDKLMIIQNITELIESKNLQIQQDVENIEKSSKEPAPTVTTNNSRSTVTTSSVAPLSGTSQLAKTLGKHKTPVVVERDEPTSSKKGLYDKPKRMRRVRTSDKMAESISERPAHNKTASGGGVDVTSGRASAQKGGVLSASAAGSHKKQLDKAESDNEIETKSEVPVKEAGRTAAKEVATKKEKEKEAATLREEKEKKELEKKAVAVAAEKKEIEPVGTRRQSGKMVASKKTTIKPSVQGKMKKKKKKEKEVVSQEELAIDPDEPVYCLCNRVSFGDMIGCDNEDCQIEWFHFGCVNLTNKPKGKWYCPGCLADRRTEAKKKT